MKLLPIVTLISANAFAQSGEIPCWLDPDLEIQPSTSQIAVLQTYLLPIDLDSPDKKLKDRIKHGDFRFIGIRGFTMYVPGLENQDLVCEHGVRIISGTSDAFESVQHLELVSEFTEYAAQYNALLEATIVAQ
jgi:hypothetical protein